MTGTWYDVGRLSRILVIFPVIQPVNTSNVYNPNGASTVNRLLINRDESNFASALEHILQEILIMFPKEAFHRTLAIKENDSKRTVQQ